VPGPLAALLTFAGIAAAQDPATFSAAREVFAAALRIAEADGGRLWGVRFRTPLLIADPATRLVIANVADEEGRLESRDGLFTGRLPDAVNVANTAVTWAGRRWTMLVGPGVPRGRYARDRLVAHEMFHGIQPELGLDVGEGDTGHLDTRDGRIWLRLEWRALAEALIREGDARRAAIADALAFRHRRRTLFPDGAESERLLELHEGLAEYTGLVLCGLPRHVLPDRAAVSLEDWDARPSFVRGFAYASGPAYGLLLDELSEPEEGEPASWRQAIDASSDLGALLARVTGIAGHGDDSGLERRAGRYGAAVLIGEETARAERRAARVAELRGVFVEGPRVVLPVLAAFRYSFDPTRAEALEGVGTVYPSVRVTDEWGTLTVSAGGALLVRGAAGVTGVVVPAPESVDAPLAGDGWELELAPGFALVAGEAAGSWAVVRR